MIGGKMSSKKDSITLDDAVAKMLRENERRTAEINATYNPITGEGAILDREILSLSDCAIPVQHIPLSMSSVPLVKRLKEAGSVKKFITDFLHVPYNSADHDKVVEQLFRIRCRHDFCFWAYWLVMIKAKGGGDDVHFRLNRPQRRLVAMYERQRLANKPIRVIILKARQWGGSTVTQIYMAWLQLVHRTGLNSLIISHVQPSSENIKDMFDRLMKYYPVRMLYQQGTASNPNEAKLVGVGRTGTTQRIPQRNCKISIGTAKSPDSCRGGDYNLVHLSEVAYWEKTKGKKPEDIVRSACSGILLKPYTMIVYESTANGTGNFFQHEYDAAKAGTSQFESIFVPWYEIEQNTAPIEDIAAFATLLYKNRNNRNVSSDREECGAYLYSLWEEGATLEAIQWYILERTKNNDHGEMAAEAPTNDTEAFVHSGARVFDPYNVAKLKATCKPPKFIGDVYADCDEGKDALKNLRFGEDVQGLLWIWAMPEKNESLTVTDRYLTVVDIGGRSSKADWSVVVVFDRLFMAEGGNPTVVAQWYGHIDMDLLAWKTAQIAAFYNNSLLVIESNTLETHDRERQVDGDQSAFILSQLKDVYPNLYERRRSEDEIAQGAPHKYGFHTNVSTKPMIISTLVKVIREHLYTERDIRCLEEYITYEKRQNGSYGAIAGKHDDLLMTRAIGLHICFFEMPTPKIKPIMQRKHHTKLPHTEATI